MFAFIIYISRTTFINLLIGEKTEIAEKQYVRYIGLLLGNLFLIGVLTIFLKYGLFFGIVALIIGMIAKYSMPKSREDRIKYLFKLYRLSVKQGHKENESLMIVWGELKTSMGLLKDMDEFKKGNLASKKKLLKQLYSLDVDKRNILSTIQFIVTWEFPKGSNYKAPSIEDIRARRDPSSVLEKRIKEIGEKIL